MLSLRILIATAAISVFPGFCKSGTTEVAAIDFGLAQEYCDCTELTEPEGIWQFPDDETTVLIRRAPHSSSKFEIFVIETPDCRLNPGDKLGELQRSADTSKFKMSLYTNRKTGILTDSHSCSAELKENGDTFIMQPRKLKISLRTMWFLPRFWRSLRIDIDNPASRLPYGLIRLYPRTNPFSPFYL